MAARCAVSPVSLGATESGVPVSEQSYPAKRQGSGFFERQIGSLFKVLEHGLQAERLAQQPGLLQRFDPRVRLLAVLLLIAFSVASRSLLSLGGLFAVTIALALLSKIPLRILASGIWANVTLFTGLLALPALFLVPGEALLQLPLLGWKVTQQGLASAAFLVCRATIAASLAALLILATPWPHLLKALRVLRAPTVLVVILAMCYRYIFLLLQLALEMFEAHRSRQLGPLSGKDKRRMLIANAGVLMIKSLRLAEEVFLAMQSRAYRGEQYLLLEFRLQGRDWAALLLLSSAAAVALYLHV